MGGGFGPRPPTSRKNAMTTLVSARGSKIAHLSYDGSTTACGTILHEEVVSGPTLGYTGASRRCLHCPRVGFIAYFDNLRRGQAVESLTAIQNLSLQKPGRPKEKVGASSD